MAREKREKTPLSELARAALLGAERESVPTPTPDSPLAPLWEQLGDVAPEFQLLSMAGVSKLYHQSGTLPPRTPTPPHQTAAASGDDITPTFLDDADSELGLIAGEDSTHKEGDKTECCTPAAGEVLVALMDGTHKTLLPEYLSMMAAANLVVPAEYLPSVLSYGINQSNLHSVIQRVTGRNGQQLAAQNPRWVYASPVQLSWDVARERWHSLKTTTARQDFLRQLRRQDPELGLRLLQSIWKSEQPSNRVALIRSLEIRLSMADEPFLEAALDDRNNSVRKKAADLLTMLPESRLCQRMARNTASLLEWVVEEDKTDDGKKSDENAARTEPTRTRIAIHFPAELSSEMQRDGVLKRTVKDDARRRRMELLDMITAVPLNVWTERWQVTPSEIVQAAQESRWPRTLTQALTQAAERQQNLDWVDALLEHAEFKLPVTKLIGLLTPDKLDALIARIDPGVDAENLLNKNHPLVIAVRRWSPTWSESLSNRWLDRLDVHIALNRETATPDSEATEPSKEATDLDGEAVALDRKVAVRDRKAAASDRKPAVLDSIIKVATKQFARCCAPSLIEEAIERLEVIHQSHPDAWAPTIEQNLATLHMRRKMQAVLKGQNDN